MNSYIVPEYFSQNELPSSARMNTIVSAIKNLNENLQSHNHTGTLNGPKLHATNALIDNSLTAKIFNASITNNDKSGLIINKVNGVFDNIGILSENQDLLVTETGLKINSTLLTKYTFKNGLEGELTTNGNPVGTVIAIIGKNVYQDLGNDIYKLKNGDYLFCNGKPINNLMNSGKYKKLIEVLTGNSNATSVNLPDLSDNRFLKGKGLNESGTPQSAGIPNIKGNSVYASSWWYYNGAWNTVVNSFSGAFTPTQTVHGDACWCWTRSSWDTKTYNVNFDAANGENHNGTYRNDIYGKSDTVTPLNVSVMYFIRY